MQTYYGRMRFSCHLFFFSEGLFKGRTQYIYMRKGLCVYISFSQNKFATDRNSKKKTIYESSLKRTEFITNTKRDLLSRQ